MDATPTRSAPRWLLVTLAVIAAAAVAFAIGRFTAFGATATPQTPGTYSADAGFARDMQLHHAQAVDMAMEIYRKTDDADVRMLAYDMATTQSAQIGEMYSWLVAWNLPQRGGELMAWMADSDGGHGGHAASTAPLSEQELRDSMGMAADEQLAALDAATGTEADCLFLTLMIRHHEGAIEMVDAVLELGTEPRVKAVASAMAEVQQFEIDAMNSSLLRLGCS